MRLKPPSMPESEVAVTIYHNPACGTSRNTLEMIRQSGEVPEIIEYLKNPPDRARLIELISRGHATLAERAAALPAMINTPELRIPCDDDNKVAVVAKVTAALAADPQVRGVVDIDGVRARFDGGWGLVRASNTQPALVMRCEADTVERLAAIEAVLRAHLAAAGA